MKLPARLQATRAPGTTAFDCLYLPHPALLSRLIGGTWRQRGSWQGTSPNFPFSLRESTSTLLPIVFTHTSSNPRCVERERRAIILTSMISRCLLPGKCLLHCACCVSVRIREDLSSARYMYLRVGASEPKVHSSNHFKTFPLFRPGTVFGIVVEPQIHNFYVFLIIRHIGFILVDQIGKIKTRRLDPSS